MRRVPHCGVGTLVLLCLLLMSEAHATPQQNVSDYQVKAAYIFNFAKFVDWPSDTFSDPRSPIRFCILSDHSFEIELNRIVKDKLIGGRRVEVIEVRDGEQSRTCHVLFIGMAQDREVPRVIAALRGTKVLTVGETSGFTQRGGMINFFLNNDNVQFQVNRKAANEAGLYISSRLLGLAARIIE